MNYFMDYVCCGIVRSEDAIGRLNKNVTKLAKCTRSNSKRIVMLAVASLLFASVVYANAKDIEDLQKQVKDLKNEVEELKEQKGA